MNTEACDPRYRELEQWPTAQAIAAMWEGQLAAVAAIGPAVPAIAAAAEDAAMRLGRHDAGRLVYAGAGTSARLAVLDGTELGPTFSWPAARVAYLPAGGMAAVTQAVEGAEDDVAAAGAAVAAARIGPVDVVVAVAASGRTPFTCAIVQAARAMGALTIAIANSPDTPLLAGADHPLCAPTGAEVLAGSTRMKAGTAQKAVLNLLSTAIMLRLGRVHRGRMVALRVANAKLAARALRLVQDLAGLDAREAERALALADGDVRLALLVARGLDPDGARAALAEAEGDVGRVLRTGA
ncbi:N-acetylmuramic acid 6-phosphate etherase [Croceibacterium sp. TMG7-5b_MA50]|uniref:N-acetylmuramic acid 6-phosphate etherase n=1 Tax=Croceibacterium sp. TMG7-5b_MA50 TaxID=3121290 RepID=UPI003221CBC1